MAAELGASLQKVFKDRVSSPLYGSFIISWLIINWQIPYVTIFESNSTLGETKVNFIKAYITNNACHTIWIPIATTIILITLGPIVSYWAVLVPEKFKQKRVRFREELNKGKLLRRANEEIAAKDIQIHNLNQDREIRSKELQGIKFLTNIFQGEWKLERTKQNGNHTEYFTLIDGDTYSVSSKGGNNEEKFQLINVSFVNANQLTFTKRPFSSGPMLKYILYKKGEKLFEGQENDSTHVKFIQE